MVYNVFNYHSNWKKINVANSSPLFETLNAFYSSALNTWSRLESHSDCLSDSAIMKLDNSQQISCYARRIFTLFIRKMQSWWELIIIKMSCLKYRVSYNQLYLATAESPRIKLKSEIVYNIYLTLKFRRYMSTQNISAIASLCFEVSWGPFGYRVAHDSWQEIHHMSSKWYKCVSHKRNRSSTAIPLWQENFSIRQSDL